MAEDSISEQQHHCLSTIARIVGVGRDDRRAVLQLGYNLGRLSELTGLGREPFWDAWKVAVESWDLDALRALATATDALVSERHSEERR